MTVPSRLDDSLARLSSALARLQAAVEQRAQADAGQADRATEFALLQDDRSRLADELDAALAQRDKLLAAQHEVYSRLDRAGRTVEHVLQRLATSAAPGAAFEDAR